MTDGAHLEVIVETEDFPETFLDLMETVADACLKLEGLTAAEACACIVGDEEIQRLNREMRGVNRVTDVLSFPSIERSGKTAKECRGLLRREITGDGRVFLGDFAISMPAAKRQAAEYGHSIDREVGYLTAHAMFHLMGYDHERSDDAAAMRAMEKRAMAEVALNRETNMKNYTDEELISMAREAMNAAYAPYSNYQVGACLLSSDGRVFTGCNVENASYGLSICAERGAIVSAVTTGARRFVKIAVVGTSGEAWPCGACRQVLNEFSDDMVVLCGSPEGKILRAPLSELLPHAFNLSEDL